MTGLSLGAYFAKFEVRIFSHFGAISIYSQNLRDYVTLAMPCSKIFWGHVTTFRLRMHAKFEIRIFNHFGAIHI